MLELRGALGLAEKSFEILGLRDASLAGNLDGDGAIEFRIARLVDGAEGPCPEAFEQFEFAQTLGRLARQPDGRRRLIVGESRTAKGTNQIRGLAARNLINRVVAMRAM